jgi:alpha-tubulin suppressor-like RCC1 family protein
LENSCKEASDDRAKAALEEIEAQKKLRDAQKKLAENDKQAQEAVVCGHEFTFIVRGGDIVWTAGANHFGQLCRPTAGQQWTATLGPVT